MHRRLGTGEAGEVSELDDESLVALEAAETVGDAVAGGCAQRRRYNAKALPVTAQGQLAHDTTGEDSGIADVPGAHGDENGEESVLHQILDVARRDQPARRGANPRRQSTDELGLR